VLKFSTSGYNAKLQPV